MGDNADANWHNAAVTVALTGVDAESGVALPSGLEYKVDGGSFTAGTSVVVPAPANGSNDGTHTITYHATNRAGVTSADKTATVKIDATAPNNVTLDSPAAAALLRGSVPLAATAQDATAGIASTTFRLVAGHARRRLVRDERLGDHVSVRHDDASPTATTTSGSQRSTQPGTGAARSPRTTS